MSLSYTGGVHPIFLGDDSHCDSILWGGGFPVVVHDIEAGGITRTTNGRQQVSSEERVEKKPNCTETTLVDR